MSLAASAKCGSYLVYVPQRLDGGAVAQQSRKFCYGLKGGDEALARRVAMSIKRHPNDSGVAGVLGENASLIPMPRSAPLKAGALWPAKMLSEALQSQGLAESVIELLRRSSRVRRSATAPPGERPTAKEHLRSFHVVRGVQLSNPIVIVDDVITTGATMLAAVSAVSAAVPSAPVLGFSFVRTVSHSGITAVRNPAFSTIRLLGDGRTRREP